MALEGPSSQDLPPSLAKYMFTRLMLRPAVSNVSTERLIRLLLDSTRTGADPARLEADAAALFTEEAPVSGSTLCPSNWRICASRVRAGCGCWLPDSLAWRGGCRPSDLKR